MTQMHTWMLWGILWLLKYIPGGDIFQGMTKLMWTKLEALLGTKYVFQFSGCDVSSSVHWAWAAGDGHQQIRMGVANYRFL